jgi:hypothetical protein
MLALLAVAFVPALYLAARAIGLPPAVGWVTAAVVCAAAVPLGLRVLPRRLGEPRRAHVVLLVVWFGLGLYAAVHVAWMSPFMLDVERSRHAFNPTPRPIDEDESDPAFYLRHNCYTSYAVAGLLAAQGAENVYDPSQYRDPVEETEIHRRIGEMLTIDRYQYPPPFLLLPRLLRWITGDFFKTRSLWFAINILAFTLTVAAFARWVARDEFGPVWLVWATVLATWIARGTLQIGNFHLLVITLSLAGMLALESRRHALGGALLGFTIASKLFPGVLLAYLVVRRSWRAVAWTLGWMTAYAAATLLLFGARPYVAFLTYHLPRLASGEAFSFARECIRPLTLNGSVMGLPFKLDKLDWLDGLDPGLVAHVMTWLYTVGLLVAIFVLGVRHLRSSPGTPERIDLVRVWIVILILGQMRSPFLPLYGNIALLWLLPLLLPRRRPAPVLAVGLAILWLVFATIVPLPWGPSTIRFDLVFTMMSFFAALGLCSVVLLDPLGKAVLARIGGLRGPN